MQQESETRINGVSMIPSGLITCFINGNEVRILELSKEAFVVRLANPIGRWEEIRFAFFQFQQSSYEEILLDDFECMEEKKEEYAITYVIATSQETYSQKVDALIEDYWRYIELKLSGDDSYCSQEKVGYPAKKDEEFAENFAMQKKEWFASLTAEAEKIQESEKIKEAEKIIESKQNKSYERYSSILSLFELCMVIDSYVKYDQYLKMGSKGYLKNQLRDNNLDNHPLAQMEPKRIYIGNQFCHNLLPTVELLEQMLEQAYKDHLKITVVSTYLREEFIQQTEYYIKCLYEWCQLRNQKIELVVNDWGMFSLLKGKEDRIEPVLGVLLNKRRKDPRYQYKSGFIQYTTLLSKNSLNYEGYRTFLKERYGVIRYEYETCGYPITLPTKHHSLHFPYYQTNTSQYCTLYAKCANLERGKQQLVYHCPRYCEEFIFSYPKHLNMVGRYNSLFGMEDTVLKDADALEYYYNQGIDRLVLTLL